MTKERTFLDPLNDAADIIRDCKDELATICRALHVVGNDAFADRIAAIAVDLNKALQLNSEGRDRALTVYVHGAEAATANMVNTALAMAGREGG